MSTQDLRTTPPSGWQPPAALHPEQVIEQSSTGLRSCPNHHPVSATARFCDLCGAPVAEASTTAAAHPPVVSPSGPFTSKQIVAGAVGLALVFAVLVGGSLTGNARSDSSTGASVLPAVLAPATTTVTGTLSLVDYETASNYCVGEGGYSDIAPGATVILTDESGKILGSTSLGKGSATYSNTTCVYPFTITDVPKDAAQYAVEVTHRGKVVNSRQDLEASAWTFELTLGS